MGEVFGIQLVQTMENAGRHLADIGIPSVLYQQPSQDFQVDPILSKSQIIRLP